MRCSPGFQVWKRQIAKHSGAQPVLIQRTVYHKKKTHFVKVDATDLDMSGEEGSAIGDHDETELFLPRSVSVTLYTVEGTTHSQLYNADGPHWTIISVILLSGAIVRGRKALSCRWAPSTHR